MPPKTVRFADTARKGREPRGGATKHEKQQTIVAKQGEPKKKRRKSSSKEIETKMNRGLLAEFVIFLVLQGFDLFSNTWVLKESYQMVNRIESLANNSSISRANSTVGFCAELQEDRAAKEVTHFQTVVGLYCFFIALAALIFTLHLLAWIHTLQLSFRSRLITQSTRDTLLKMKLYFLVAASLLQDIPLSAIAAELFTLQQGKQGLACWYCKMSGLCPEMKDYNNLKERSSNAILLNISAIGLTSLWKGISSFYRWSKIPNFNFFHLRACTSVFSGTLFAIVILTPAMTVLKYRYFVKDGISASFLSDAIDRVYVIGIMAWVFCAAVLCCCPLLRVIRLTT